MEGGNLVTCDSPSVGVQVKLQTFNYAVIIFFAPAKTRPPLRNVQPVSLHVGDLGDIEQAY